MYNTIKYETFSDGYIMITLDRESKRNAVSNEMVRELKDALSRARDSQLKFLVITGSGEKMFCAGGDLQDFHGNLSPSDAFQKLYPMKEVLLDIVSFPVPTICLLNGNAIGGGCEIATACDIRIAKESTKFGFVQSTIGITPGWGGGALLYEKVLPSFAYAWLIEGTNYEVEFLIEKGWIHRVIPYECWNNYNEIFEPYISKSYAQMEILSKQYQQKIEAMGLSALMDSEVHNCSLLWDSPEHINAVNQFLNKKV
ncbi:enoyl-CoA hydratase/isomerase family protein [Virgibacillus flavescens]|uniref:enoyl-CoA hydratase/isomerase family protein n=1 Tax=Virgibacillus flavescens TaxID=1611422 RepID=UPI003D334B10